LSASWGAGIQQGSCTINGVSAEPKDRQRQQYDELGRQVEEDFDWRFIPMTVIMITAFWGMVGLVWLGSTTIYRVLFLHVHGVPVYLAVTIAASCFFLAAIVCTLRDLRNWRSVAWFQILISIAGGVTSLIGSDFSASGIMGFAAAVFAGATGFKRLYEISAAESKAAQS
jgi:hypothetical protein